MRLSEALLQLFASSPSLGVLALFVLLSLAVGVVVAAHDGIEWVVRRWRA